jgi:aryl-alcohol dehydrogenase-like predicted oxidoreductase
MKDGEDAEVILQKHILGTAGLGGVWGNIDQKESINTILNALEFGFVAIDTAPAYGEAEFLVGKALQQWKGAAPQISTKVGRLKSYSSDKGIYDYSAGGMRESLHSSLEVLGVPHIDVLFLHEPDAIPVAQAEQAVEQMIEFRAQGFARKIGLGGNHPSFKKYIDAGVFDILMEYNRLDGCCIDALDTTLPDCINKGMNYWAASPLHMGLLGSRFEAFTQSRPDWIAEDLIKKAIALKDIADDYQLSLPSLALRFLQCIPYEFKIILGPSNQQEFNNCLENIVRGPLEKEIYDRVVNCL